MVRVGGRRRIVFGSRLLLTLLLFGWLAGFYIVPEGLAAPYARSLHGNALTVGLLMAAVPLGMVIGAFVVSRIAGAMAQVIGAPLAMSWTHLPGRLIQARPNGPESPGPGG